MPSSNVTQSRVVVRRPYDPATAHVTANFFQVNGVESETRLRSLFAKYEGSRYTENYSPDAVNKLLAEDRFSLGIVEVLVDTQIQAFFGLARFRDWAVVTRAVELNGFSYEFPIILGCGLPFACDYFKHNQKLGIKGLMMTFNAQNTGLFRMFFPNPRQKNSPWTEHPVHQNFVALTHAMKSLPRVVRYNYTDQQVAYLPFTEGEAPPFLESEYVTTESQTAANDRLLGSSQD